ncbi:hypothetical protein DKX38_025847 [Salix brachista]|uniref:Reverse transcriptase Ty1/copia-type domain-containing protein n=1 Tax=Salix brachista TaxID=2182728 RepID=A0A5N5JQ61_9ROSI|nr:hypothetical protein DKX38_025847 [Salix brachista]
MNKPDLETSGNKHSPIIIRSEGSSFNAGILLNETNYDMWSQIIEMHIAEKEKLSFIRDTKTPTEKEEGYEKWYADNQKVKRWLLMSMSPEIMKRYLRLPTAHHRDKVIMESEKDVESYRKLVQRQRVHNFLAGLDDDFEQIRGEILRKEPVPDLEESYALIRREFVRRTMMNGETEQFETAAMVAYNRSGKHQQRYNFQKNGVDKTPYKCSHCDQNGHTKNKCFELVGYPDWWDHNRDPRKKNPKMSASTAAVVETHENNILCEQQGTSYDSDVMETSDDDFQPEVIHHEKDESSSSNQHESQQRMTLLVYDVLPSSTNDPSQIEFSQFSDQEPSHLKAAMDEQTWGQLHHFLGIEIAQTPDGLHLSQSHYALTILEKANIVNSKPMSTPLETKTKTSSDILFEDPSYFRGFVGALQYLPLTRPDLFYNVNYA